VGKPISGIEAVRSRELGRLFDHRWGQQLPDDDAGRDDMRLMLGLLAALPNASERVRHFLELRCPWLADAERDAEVEAAFRSGPSRLTADEIAQRLGVDLATRTRLRLTTIGAIDRDAAARMEDRRRRKAAAERERRAKNARAKAAAQMPSAKRSPAEIPRTAYVLELLRDEAFAAPGDWWTSGEVARATNACLSPFANLADEARERATRRALQQLAAAGEIEVRFDRGKTGLPIMNVRMRPGERGNADK
jgi:hypothetical protein